MMQHHNITINQLMLVILSIRSTSKASKKWGNVFYHVYKRFFYFSDKNAFLTFFLNFFPNVYYIYASNVTTND